MRSPLHRTVRPSLHLAVRLRLLQMAPRPAAESVCVAPTTHRSPGTERSHLCAADIAVSRHRAFADCKQPGGEAPLHRRSRPSSASASRARSASSWRSFAYLVRMDRATAVGTHNGMGSARTAGSLTSTTVMPPSSCWDMGAEFLESVLRQCSDVSPSATKCNDFPREGGNQSSVDNPRRAGRPVHTGLPLVRRRRRRHRAHNQDGDPMSYSTEGRSYVVRSSANRWAVHRSNDGPRIKTFDSKRDAETWIHNATTQAN